MKKIFNNAIADRIIETNPVIGIEFFKEPNRSIDFLSEEESRRLLRARDTEAIRAFVTLGLNTGMRLNELLPLKWDDVIWTTGLSY